MKEIQHTISIGKAQETALIQQLSDINCGRISSHRIGGEQSVIRIVGATARTSMLIEEVIRPYRVETNRI